MLILAPAPRFHLSSFPQSVRRGRDRPIRAFFDSVSPLARSGPLPKISLFSGPFSSIPKTAGSIGSPIPCPSPRSCSPGSARHRIRRTEMTKRQDQGSAGRFKNQGENQGEPKPREMGPLTACEYCRKRLIPRGGLLRLRKFLDLVNFEQIFKKFYEPPGRHSGNGAEQHGMQNMQSGEASLGCGPGKLS